MCSGYWFFSYSLYTCLLRASHVHKYHIYNIYKYDKSVLHMMFFFCIFAFRHIIIGAMTTVVWYWCLWPNLNILFISYFFACLSLAMFVFISSKILFPHPKTTNYILSVFITIGNWLESESQKSDLFCNSMEKSSLLW